MDRDHAARGGVGGEHALGLEGEGTQINARPQDEDGGGVYRPHRLNAGAAAGGFAPAGVTRLEHQQFLAGKLVHPALDLVDATEHILEGTGVIDGGPDEPDLS